MTRPVHAPRRERAWRATNALVGLARRAAPLLACIAAGACGGAQGRLGPVFMPEWEDDGGKSIRAVQTQLASQPVPVGAAVAVGATESAVIGMPLGGGSPWRFAHPLASRPAVAGTVVVGEGGGELFALEAASGRKLWSRPSSGHVRGIGDDGRTTVISLTGTGDNESTVLAVERDGKVVRQIEAKPVVGTPAVVGSYVFLPWAGQYVSVYDLSRGIEIARATFREQISRAFAEDGALFFGELGLFRFDDQVGGASAGRASHVGLPVRALPGDPHWFRPGGDLVPVRSDARDRIELFGHPTAQGELAVEGDRFVATYFRVVLGLAARDGKLAWVDTNDADVIGGAPFAGGVALCDAAGKVRILDGATGASAATESLGEPVESCVVQADGFTLPRPAGGSRPSLANQIADAIQVNQPELASIQRVLLHELAKLPDEIGTKILIDLAGNPRTSPLLLPDARDELAKRRTGPELMVQALERHYDYLKDVLTPPPVGPIADALAAMKWRSAAGVLASHLSDPADTTDDVKRVAAALVQIGGPAEAPALEKFFALYRGAADDENLVGAVASAADALLRFGNDEQKKLVQAAATEPSTVDAVRDALRTKPGEGAEGHEKPTPAAGSPHGPKARSGAKGEGARSPARPFGR